MRSLRNSWWVAIIVTVIALATIGSERNVRGGNKINKDGLLQDAVGDMVCGPRCVQFLLRHYGKDGDLIDLTREIQWPDFEAGASLDALEQALQERGIYTHALQIGSCDRIRWSYPVLVHLKGRSQIGHYVVWLSSNQDNEQVWVGLAGIQWGEASRLAERRSGAILLTSPVPILNPESAVYRPVMVLPWMFVCASLVLLLVVLKPGIYRPLRRLVLSATGKGVKSPVGLLDTVVKPSGIAQERKENLK